MTRAAALLPAALLLVSLASAGCREVPAGAYVELTGKIFVFNYRLATASYVVTLGKLRPLPDGAIAVTEFDDPNGGADILVTQKIWPKMDKIAIESPPVFCVVKGRPYKFTISISAEDGAQLQSLQGTVVSSLDQTVLPDVPLVVGNAYTPNPVLEGRPDGKFGQKAAVKCKR